MKDSFVFYRSFFEALTGMDKESQADCLMAIADYALNDKEPNLTPEVRMFFTLVKPQIDANKKRFENGSKGGRPKKPNNNLEVPKIEPNNNQEETKPKPNVNVNVNVNENVNVNKDVKYGELGLVRLTEDQYKSLKANHSNLDNAIEVLDTWLGTSGSKNKNKNHYAYFKSNSWVWERAGANNNTKPDPVELYLQIDNQKREEQQRLASAAEKAMELARQKAMSKFGG